MSGIGVSSRVLTLHLNLIKEPLPRLRVRSNCEQVNYHLKYVDQKMIRTPPRNQEAMVSPLQSLTVGEHDPLGRSPLQSRRNGESLLEILIDVEKSIKSLL